MLRAILFDFNGVLLNDEPLHLELFQTVLAEEGIPLTTEDYYSHYLGYDDRGCFTAALAAAGTEATPERLAALIDRKAAAYQQRVERNGFPFFPGARELISGAADAGLTLGVVSGALGDEIEGALAQVGQRSCFKTVVSADDVEQSKPHPEGYQRGLDHLNRLPPRPHRSFDPREVLAIEDSPAGLEAAAACGLATLGVAQTYTEDKLAAADRVVGAVSDLTASGLQEMFASSAPQEGAG